MVIRALYFPVSKSLGAFYNPNVLAGMLIMNLG
jgi:hypothetical protein